MIDTVALTLKFNDCTSVDLSRFTNKSFEKSSKGYLRNNFFKAIQNPTKQDMLQGIYNPRLTLYSRFGEMTIRVEFSIPKLLFKNNFDEVTGLDFDLVIDTLNHKLKHLGLVVESEVLSKCEVSVLHYSKNIILDNYIVCYQVLNELNKVDFNQRLDLNQTDFRNNGYSLKFRNNSLEICFYDKIKDLEQAKVTEKRSIEKDNYIQLGLFESVKNKRLEVLRYEVRLGNKNKIKQLFKTLHIDKDLSFKAIYNIEISKKVLLYYFNIMQKDYLNILSNNEEAEQFITNLMLQNNNLSLNKVMMYYGYKKALQELGISKFRLITSEAKGSWSRIKKGLVQVDFTKSVYDPLSFVKEELVRFENVNYEQQ